MVPAEFGRSLPVPAKDGGYRILFYPLLVSPGKSEVLTPQFAAVLPADASAAARCEKIGRGPASSLGPGVNAGLSNADYYRAEAAVYAGLPRAAQLYRGGGAAASDQAALAAFVAAFQTIAEPGLIPSYYGLNPDFWEWLRKTAGTSLPKSST